jgi:hypothetical protein
MEAARAYSGRPAEGEQEVGGVIFDYLRIVNSDKCQDKQNIVFLD